MLLLEKIIIYMAKYPSRYIFSHLASSQLKIYSRKIIKETFLL